MSDGHITPLKNCPLCGGKAKFIEDECGMVWFAECGDCGLMLGLPNGYSSRLDLCEDWNKRLNQDAELSQFKNPKNWTRSYDHKGDLLREHALYLPYLKDIGTH